AISALNPYFQGIGGSSGGFNFFQTIIAGIQPPTTDSKVSYTIYIEDDFTTNVSSIARNQKVVLNNTLLSNQGIHDFNGEIAVGLYQNNDLIEIFDSQPVSFQSKNWTNISWDFNVPLSIPNGTYELYPIYKGNDQTDWSIIRSISMISISLGIVISDETIEFFTPADALPQLRIPEGGFTYSDLYSHFPATFHIRLENTGKEAYTEMWILIMSEDETFYETVASNIICISQGETIDVDFTGVIPVPSGAYKAVLYYATPNNPVEVAGENRLPIVVNRFPPTTPELAFKVTPAVNPVEVMKNGQMTVSATIENEGLSADGNMHVFIYQFTGGNHLKTYHQPFTLAQDESIFFQMEVPIELDKGKYYLMLQYVEGEDRHYVKRFDEQVTFLVVEGTAISELKDREPFHIYPNPVRDYLLVETQETIQSLRIFNVSGVQIRSEYSSETRNEIRIPTGNLAPGIYFLQITTTQGTVLKKFIKQ
ncbi:MAG: T9SS type A sorting domain-containing protein, partial [Candidatus Symbiothrix sp.]|nr:T9SS type A sorting domain-containing protein [Candidatus Symbiothrix sp.]